MLSWAIILISSELHIQPQDTILMTELDFIHVVRGREEEKRENSFAEFFLKAGRLDSGFPIVSF